MGTLLIKSSRYFISKKRTENRVISAIIVAAEAKAPRQNRAHFTWMLITTDWVYVSVWVCVCMECWMWLSHGVAWQWHCFHIDFDVFLTTLSFCSRSPSIYPICLCLKFDYCFLRHHYLFVLVSVVVAQSVSCHPKMMYTPWYFFSSVCLLWEWTQRAKDQFHCTHTEPEIPKCLAAGFVSIISFERMVRLFWHEFVWKRQMTGDNCTHI